MTLRRDSDGKLYSTASVITEQVRSKDLDDPSITCPAYDAMKDDWDLISDLLGGTRAMREAGERWLPKERDEEPDEYKARLKLSFLFNGLSRTIGTLVGKPFAKPVALGEDIKSPLKEYMEDVDLLGNNLHVFARDTFTKGLGDGLVHILVEYPKTDAERTLADERAQGLRPYFVRIDARNVIGWRVGIVHGRERLLMVRIREEGRQPSGRFGEKAVPRIRVLEAGQPNVGGGMDNATFTVYEQQETNENGSTKTKWVTVEEGEFVGMTEIPLVTFYAERTGPMTATPPLMDLAWLNLEHWVNSSDSANIRHVASVPILFGAGFNDKDNISIGARRAIKNPRPESKLEFVEYGGAAIEAQRKHLEDVENRMRALGMELLVKRPGNVTATGRVLDQAEMDSELSAMVGGIEDALEQALVFMGQWVDKPDAAGSIEIEKKFGISPAAATHIEALLKSRLGGEISQETFLVGLKRYEVLPNDLDVAAEVEATVKERTGLQDGMS